MAEAVVFGGSPLDQYLRDADRPEEQTHMDQGETPSEPSTPGAGWQYASSLGDTPSAPSRVESLTSPVSVVRDSATSPPIRADRHLHKDFRQMSPPNHRRSAQPERDNQVKSQSNPSETQSATFPSQLVNTLHALIQRFFVPLMLMIARNVFGLRQPHDSSTHFGQSSPQPNAYKSYSRRASNCSFDDGATTFVEKFKYAICSSFLLTPSLSISFYESNAPTQTQSPIIQGNTAGRPSKYRVRGRRASSIPIHKHCYVEPEHAIASLLPRPPRSSNGGDDRLPRLDAQGRIARNAALISALLLIPPISRSWQVWISTVLLIASLTWAYVLSMGHIALDDGIQFTLSRQASPNVLTSATSLRASRITNDLSEEEKAALQRAILKDVFSLIQAAQHFDVSINKAISAIQEVEIVSRGYKLTHPLPPISRIEAASGQASMASHVASPSRQRRSMVASFVPATGKLARSLSGGGNGAPTIRRHAQRPLSLNLSSGRASPLDRPSGRASPATFVEGGDLDPTQRLLAEQSDVAQAAGRAAPQRLVELRKSLVLALEDVGSACSSSTASLQLLADPEELALLHDLYALDANPQDEANDVDADVSHAWTNGDNSALSESSPDLEHDRKAWVATTPRNFGSNVRSADVSGLSEGVWRPDYSPQAAPLHHKRLSLVSDGGSVLDRQPRATSSMSRRSSLISESGNVSAYRSPRFNYVSERTASVSGPNESAAAKRLSYISNSSVATGSIDTRSPVMRNTSIASSTFSPPHSSAQTYSAATSPQSRATKRSSILGPNSIFAQLDPSIAALAPAEPVDPLSLLSIKAKFESMHRARRRWLCHLLALRLTMDGDVSLADGAGLPCDEYWAEACSRISSLQSNLHAQSETIKDLVAKEMDPDFLAGHRANLDSQRDARSESRNGLLAVPNGEPTGFSVTGHPGIEDRLHTMMLSLRSIQSKIRVCAEDIRVKPPPGLHGTDDPKSGRDSSLELSKKAENGVDEAAATLLLERTLESMRDDLLGLSAEWEATVKLVHKEKRRTPSPNLSTDLDSDVARSNAARDLESPLEADEEGSAPSRGDQSDVEEHLALSEQYLQDGAKGAASDDDDDDSDLAQLLLRSTSPNSLPPPGLEQVFESIAGMAGLSGLQGDGHKATRAERIEQARRQREQDRLASEKASHRHTMDPSSMMSELSDVIQSRKAVREQRHRSVLLPTPTADSFAWQQTQAYPIEQPALALGSPLDLGSAGHEGVFGAAHSFVDDQAIPRRSLSSLDLARARALQTLESRSPSVASSNASNSFDAGDESQPRMSDEFSFEPTALESVPEDDAAATAAVKPNESPSAHLESTSRKSTPKASNAPLSTTALNEEATPGGPDSPFDLGAQVAAYARRQKAAKAAAMQASGSESSMSSQV